MAALTVGQQLRDHILAIKEPAQLLSIIKKDLFDFEANPAGDLLWVVDYSQILIHEDVLLHQLRIPHPHENLQKFAGLYKQVLSWYFSRPKVLI